MEIILLRGEGGEEKVYRTVNIEKVMNRRRIN